MDIDMVQKIDKNARMMDLIVKDVNFKRGLAQKNLSRMSNKRNRRVIEFRESYAEDSTFCFEEEKRKGKRKVFHIEFGKHSTYEDLMRRVAEKFDVDLSRIRLRSHICQSNKPDREHIEYRVDLTAPLWITSQNSNKICNVFYYEVLDEWHETLPEVKVPECSKTVKVSYGYPYSKQISVAVQKQSSVKHLLKHEDVVKLTKSNGQLRLVGIYDYKIYRVFSHEEKIDKIPVCVKLRAEEIPEDLGEGHHEIRVHHFNKTDCVEISEFGKPFLFVIHDNETLAEIKVRIQKKVSVGNEKFSKWRFAVLLLGRPKYLKDTDVVSNYFKQLCDDEKYLGLDHPINDGRVYVPDDDMMEDLLFG